MSWLESVGQFITDLTGNDVLSYGLLIIFVALWIYSVLRVIKDVMYRSSSGSLQFVSVMFVILGTPLVGLPLYFLIRPVSYKHERHVGFEGLDLQTVVCRECYRTNLADYNNCVFCGSKLKIVCKQCNTEYPFNYLYCFKCGAPNIEL
ncbi:MAG TPA: hypothetical protein PLW93_03740 [Candidatus Absconditabacterales bacterium]|nr:hypothetical protein [Candidatus Absconditabacterales bacterium]HNG97358.1 hypothetical protein [Candidatus Absconditabacterales bacterium]